MTDFGTDKLVSIHITSDLPEFLDGEVRARVKFFNEERGESWTQIACITQECATPKGLAYFLRNLAECIERGPASG